LNPYLSLRRKKSIRKLTANPSFSSTPAYSNPHRGFVDRNSSFSESDQPFSQPFGTSLPGNVGDVAPVTGAFPFTSLIVPWQFPAPVDHAKAAFDLGAV
jgi:hypothetical protein